MTTKDTHPAIELSREELQELCELSTSQTEPVQRVTRARILLAYHDGLTKAAIARLTGVSRPTVSLCINKAMSAGVQLALRDLGRTGRPNVITADDKAWLVTVACSQPANYGYTAKTWSHSHLAQHVRKTAKSSGHPSLQNAGKVTVQRILKEHNIRPQNTPLCSENHTRNIQEKTAQVLVVCKRIEVFRPAWGANGSQKRSAASSEDWPGVGILSQVAADLAPVPIEPQERGSQFLYRQHDSVSLLAGIDLQDGHVHALVRDLHRSREFIWFLQEVDRHYPSDWKLKLVLDEHAEHVSRETMQWLAGRPGRFEFVFTPKNASGLSMVEVLFSKMARSFLRSLRVASKDELVHMLYQRFKEINASPV